MTSTINPIKNIFEKNINDDVHNAFTRYSVGEFEKENFIIKFGKKQVTIYTGFEYLNFLQRFLSQNLTGKVTIEGVIESVRNLKFPNFKVEEKRRFGKSGTKFTFEKQEVSVNDYKKLIEDNFNEFLLLDVKTDKVYLKVKSKTTPKLGNPTEKFITLKMSHDLFNKFKEDFLFDVEIDKFKEIILNHTYFIDDIKVDEKLLETDSLRARKEAKRVGSIKRKVTIDGVVKKEETVKFLS